jgi:gas vesicle protein
MMLEDVEDRHQFVAGLVFTLTLVVAWAAITVLEDGIVGLVVGAMIATAVTAVFVGYTRFREREQEYKERYESHRYRANRAREEFEEFADESGISDAVAEIGPRISDATERLRDRQGHRRDADEREGDDDV